MSDPNAIVTISAQQLYQLVQRIEDSANDIGASVKELTIAVARLEQDVRDHDGRIRIVEARADTVRRLDIIEGHVAQQDQAFIKQGERLGRLEARLDARVSPIAVAAVIGTFAAIVVSIVLALI